MNLYVFACLGVANAIVCSAFLLVVPNGYKHVHTVNHVHVPKLHKPWCIQFGSDDMYDICFLADFPITFEQTLALPSLPVFQMWYGYVKSKIGASGITKLQGGFGDPHVTPQSTADDYPPKSAVVFLGNNTSKKSFSETVAGCNSFHPLESELGRWPVKAIAFTSIPGGVSIIMSC